MSVNYFARGLKLLRRSAFSSTSASVAGRAHRFFSASTFRQNVAGKAGKASATRLAQAWAGQHVLAVAAAAGAVGWGLASLNLGGIPGAMLMDSKAPKYASLREMKLVGYKFAGPPLFAMDRAEESYNCRPWKTSAGK